MEDITIYHNGACSKCKGALELLQERNIPHEVRWYLAEPLSKDELKELLHKLNMNARDLLRKDEVLYKSEYEAKELSEDEWIQVLIDKPELMQRPIVVKGSHAIIARPPEKVLELL